MRNAAVARDIERVGSVNNSVKFGINASSAKAFKVLSSTLYKDKILAVVREYSTNARDSLIMAGRGDQPFHVHLPNALEPFFSVKDDGLGLSDASVQKIWTTYFESTKNETDAEPVSMAKKKPTGTLGLGSKSGFAYVDSFTLVSRFGGVKRVYTSFINEEGCPEIVTMGSPEATDECNGVEVIIPVGKAADYREFSHRAHQIYELFEPKPVVTGAANFKVRQDEVVLSGNGWKLFKRDHGGARAIMGSLAYPIYAGSIQGIGDNLKRLLQSPIDIDFELDTLDFTAGREELSYDHDITQPTLRARLTEVYDDIREMVDKEFLDCETEFEARRKYAMLFGADHYSYGSYPLPSIVGRSVKWRGIVINKASMEISFKDLSRGFAIENFGMVEYWKKTGGNDYRMRRDETTNDGKQTSYLLRVDKELLIVILDLKTDFLCRVKRYLAENKTMTVLLFRGNDDDIDKIRKRCKGAKFILASTLPKPVNKKPRQKTRVRILGYQNFERKSVSYDWMINDNIDMDEGGTYVVLSKGKIVGFDDNDCFFRTYQLAKEAQLIEKIHVMPPSLHKTIEENKKWKSFSEHLLTKVKSKRNDPSVQKAVASGEIITAMKVLDLYEYGIGRFPPMFQSGIGHSHPICNAINDFTMLVRAGSAHEKLVALMNHLGIKAEKTQDNITSSFKELREKYPMLFLAFHKSNVSASDAAIDYVKLVDSQRSLAKDIA